jgi:hypothetical protein
MVDKPELRRRYLMNREEQLKAHLLLDLKLQHQPRLLKELLRNPRSVFERLGVDDGALRCPEEVHSAYARAKRIAEEVEALGDIGLTEALPRIADVARRKLGDDYSVDKVPFGLLFREQVPDRQNMDWTATATFECVFGPGCHADVDG